MEIVNYDTWDNPFTMFQIMGFGKQDPSESLLLSPGSTSLAWGPVLHLVASAIGLQLDDVQETHEILRADEDFEIASGPDREGDDLRHALRDHRPGRRRGAHRRRARHPPARRRRARVAAGPRLPDPHRGRAAPEDRARAAAPTSATTTTPAASPPPCTSSTPSPTSSRPTPASSRCSTCRCTAPRPSSVSATCGRSEPSAVEVGDGAVGDGGGAAEARRRGRASAAGAGGRRPRARGRAARLPAELGGEADDLGLEAPHRLEPAVGPLPSGQDGGGRRPPSHTTDHSRASGAPGGIATWWTPSRVRLRAKSANTTVLARRAAELAPPGERLLVGAPPAGRRRVTVGWSAWARHSSSMAWLRRRAWPGGCSTRTSRSGRRRRSPA